MAKQKGFIKIEGTIDDVNFYKTSGDGYLIRKKPGISRNRYRSDPAFQRTRENGAEFGGVAKASKLFRAPFARYSKIASDSKINGRLNKAMMVVKMTDSTSVRGERTVAKGNLNLLSGFEFNSESIFKNVFIAPFTASIDRTTGNMTVNIPSFIPAKDYMRQPERRILN